MFNPNHDIRPDCSFSAITATCLVGPHADENGGHGSSLPGMLIQVAPLNPADLELLEPPARWLPASLPASGGWRRTHARFPGPRRCTGLGAWRVLAHGQVGWVAPGRLVARLCFFLLRLRPNLG